MLIEVSNQTQVEQAQVSTGNIKQEIRLFTRKIKGYAEQEWRLMSVLRLDVATLGIVLDDKNQMKKGLPVLFKQRKPLIRWLT